MANWKLAAVLFIVLFVTSIEGQGQASALSETVSEEDNPLVDIIQFLDKYGGDDDDGDDDDDEDDNNDNDDIAYTVADPVRALAERYTMQTKRDFNGNNGKYLKRGWFSKTWKGVKKVTKKIGDGIKKVGGKVKSYVSGTKVGQLTKQLICRRESTLGKVAKWLVCRRDIDDDERGSIDAENCEAEKTGVIEDLKDTMVRLASLVDVLELQDCNIVVAIDTDDSADNNGNDDDDGDDDEEDDDDDDIASDTVEDPVRALAKRYTMQTKRDFNGNNGKYLKRGWFSKTWKGVKKVTKKIGDGIKKVGAKVKSYVAGTKVGKFAKTLICRRQSTLGKIAKYVVCRRDTDVDAENCEADKTANIQDLKDTLVLLASVVSVLEQQDCSIVGAIDTNDSTDTSA